MNPEKLAKLQAQAAQVRIGGKGSARRKKKFVHRSAVDDKKIQKEASKAEPDVKPGPSQPKKEEPKITEHKLSEEFIEKCNVSTSTVAPIEVKVDTAKIKELAVDLCDEDALLAIWKKRKEHTIVAQSGVHFNEKNVEPGNDPGIFGTWPEGMSNCQRWNDKIFYSFDELKHLEAVLNSRTDYEKGHKLRALCTVFFTRVDKELLVKIKNETENEILRKKAEQDSGVIIDDVRHIGLGRTVRVHCRTPTGASIIVKKGLQIGGITLRKGKLEEHTEIVQCTHCWKIDHKISKCPLMVGKCPLMVKDSVVCGTCGKTGHGRKVCPTPNNPKCVLCEGMHSSSSARCPVRQAKIQKKKLKADKKDKKEKSSENTASQREKLMNALADMIIGSTK